MAPIGVPTTGRALAWPASPASAQADITTMDIQLVDVGNNTIEVRSSDPMRTGISRWNNQRDLYHSLVGLWKVVPYWFADQGHVIPTSSHLSACRLALLALSPRW